MLKVQVESPEFKTKAGTSAKTGRPYSIREQEAWMYCVGKDGKPYPHPQKIRLTLDDDQQPYPVGFYQLAPSSVYVDKFESPALRARLIALPVAAAAPVRSAA